MKGETVTLAEGLPSNLRVDECGICLLELKPAGSQGLCLSGLFTLSAINYLYDLGGGLLFFSDSCNTHHFIYKIVKITYSRMVFYTFAVGHFSLDLKMLPIEFGKNNHDTSPGHLTLYSLTGGPLPPTHHALLH